MKKLPVAILTAVIIGAPLGGLAYDQYLSAENYKNQNMGLEAELNSYMGKNTDPLSVNIDIPFKKESNNFGTYWTESGLKSNAEECGTEMEETHFLELMQAFEGNAFEGYDYIFTEGGVSHTYVVFKNYPQYKTLTEFQKDFNICAVGGQAYPIRMNQDWLMFSESWGGGAAVSEEDQEKAEALKQLQEKLEAKGALELN